MTASSHPHSISAALLATIAEHDKRLPSGASISEPSSSHDDVSAHAQILQHLQCTTCLVPTTNDNEDIVPTCFSNSIRGINRCIANGAHNLDSERLGRQALLVAAVALPSFSLDPMGSLGPTVLDNPEEADSNALWYLTDGNELSVNSRRKPAVKGSAGHCCRSRKKIKNYLKQIDDGDKVIKKKFTHLVKQYKKAEALIGKNPAPSVRRKQKLRNIVAQINKEENSAKKNLTALTKKCKKTKKLLKHLRSHSKNTYNKKSISNSLNDIRKIEKLTNKSHVKLKNHKKIKSLLQNANKVSLAGRRNLKNVAALLMMNALNRNQEAALRTSQPATSSVNVLSAAGVSTEDTKANEALQNLLAGTMKFGSPREQEEIQKSIKNYQLDQARRKSHETTLYTPRGNSKFRNIADTLLVTSSLLPQQAIRAKQTIASIKQANILQNNHHNSYPITAPNTAIKSNNNDTSDTALTLIENSKSSNNTVNRLVHYHNNNSNRAKREIKLFNHNLSKRHWSKNEQVAALLGREKSSSVTLMDPLDVNELVEKAIKFFLSNTHNKQVLLREFNNNETNFHTWLSRNIFGKDLNKIIFQQEIKTGKHISLDFAQEIPNEIKDYSRPVQTQFENALQRHIEAIMHREAEIVNHCKADSEKTNLLNNEISKIAADIHLAEIVPDKESYVPERFKRIKHLDKKHQTTVQLYAEFTYNKDTQQDNIIAYYAKIKTSKGNDVYMHVRQKENSLDEFEIYDPKTNMSHPVKVSETNGYFIIVSKPSRSTHTVKATTSRTMPVSVDGMNSVLSGTIRTTRAPTQQNNSIVSMARNTAPISDHKKSIRNNHADHSLETVRSFGTVPSIDKSPSHADTTPKLIVASQEEYRRISEKYEQLISVFPSPTLDLSVHIHSILNKRIEKIKRKFPKLLPDDFNSLSTLDLVIKKIPYCPQDALSCKKTQEVSNTYSMFEIALGMHRLWLMKNDVKTTYDARTNQIIDLIHSKDLQQAMYDELSKYQMDKSKVAGLQQYYHDMILLRCMEFIADDKNRSEHRQAVADFLMSKNKIQAVQFHERLLKDVFMVPFNHTPGGVLFCIDTPCSFIVSSEQRITHDMMGFGSYRTEIPVFPETQAFRSLVMSKMTISDIVKLHDKKDNFKNKYVIGPYIVMQVGNHYTIPKSPFNFITIDDVQKMAEQLVTTFMDGLKSDIDSLIFTENEGQALKDLEVLKNFLIAGQFISMAFGPISGFFANLIMDFGYTMLTNEQANLVSINFPETAKEYREEVRKAAILSALFTGINGFSMGSKIANNLKSGERGYQSIVEFYNGVKTDLNKITSKLIGSSDTNKVNLYGHNKNTVRVHLGDPNVNYVEVCKKANRMKRGGTTSKRGCFSMSRIPQDNIVQTNIGSVRNYNNDGLLKKAFKDVQYKRTDAEIPLAKIISSSEDYFPINTALEKLKDGNYHTAAENVRTLFNNKNLFSQTVVDTKISAMNELEARNILCAIIVRKQAPYGIYWRGTKITEQMASEIVVGKRLQNDGLSFFSNHEQIARAFATDLTGGMNAERTKKVIFRLVYEQSPDNNVIIAVGKTNKDLYNTQLKNIDMKLINSAQEYILFPGHVFIVNRIDKSKDLLLVTLGIERRWPEPFAGASVLY